MASQRETADKQSAYAPPVESDVGFLPRGQEQGLSEVQDLLCRSQPSCRHVVMGIDSYTVTKRSLQCPMPFQHARPE